MTTTARHGALFGGVLGTLQQLVNELMSRVAIPIGPLPDVPVGDVRDAPRGAARDAADAVEVLLDAITGRRDVDPVRARTTRPLVHELTIAAGAAGTTTRLVVDAVAPGADWQRAGAESALLAVYVDGRYHSTITVLGERREPYQVNLGALPPGPHHVELRAATDAGPLAATVRSAAARTMTGDDALVDRLSPIIVLRDIDPGPGASAASNDTPLLLTPAITRHPDGSRTIEYRYVMSHEDGGTAAPDLLAKYGRTVDAEALYRVTVGPDGRVRSAEYQSPVHRWLPFDGELLGERPVLRVSTANNLVSARPGLRGAERWSDAAASVIDPTTSDHEVLRTHPWAWTIMAKELLREGRTAPADAVRGARQVGDPRTYVFLGPLDDAARAAIALAGGVYVELADGRRVLARTGSQEFASGEFHQTALELPAGTTGDVVRGVVGITTSAIVLDPQLAMRELTHVPA